MSFQAIAIRQNNLDSTIKGLQHLTHQLATQQVQSPGVPQQSSGDSTPADHEELRADLTAEILAGYKQCQEDLEDLQQDVEDLDPAAARGPKRKSTAPMDRDDEVGRLSTECVKLGEDLKHLHARFRKAQLQAKANATRAEQRERTAYLASLQAAAAAYNTSTPDTDDQSKPTQPKYTDLFAGRRGPKARDPTSTNDDILLTASSDVTAGLKRTHALLTDELGRSHFATETLATSNAALAELNERYAGFNDLVSRSSGLLGTLLRSQKSDTWYLETAIYVLLSTLAWLIFRRLLYGPLWWIAYLPLRTLWAALSTALGAAGLTSPRADTSRPSTIVHSMPTSSAATPHTSASAGGSAADHAAAPVPRSPPGSVSDEVGAEAERARAQQGGERVVRGDGAVLPERDEAAQPRNPKKRDFQEEPRPAGGQQGSGEKEEL